MGTLWLRLVIHRPGQSASELQVGGAKLMKGPIILLHIFSLYVATAIETRLINIAYL